MHYTVYYDLDVIGSQLLEASGNNWWKIVLQENKAGRNAIQETRWLRMADGSCDGGGNFADESEFISRISVCMVYLITSVKIYLLI